MNSAGSGKLLLAATGGDTVKLFDVSLEPQNPCVLTYIPSPGSRVNSIKWNHNNLVLATAGQDGKISMWRKNGRNLWTLPAKNARSEIPESSEAISTINFSNKGSRYLCSGGSGQVVRIWDLQNKRCIKWLKGHTDTITGVVYNCKDEHIASVSRKGDLILHNLASGTRAAELRDPNGQVLGALDYSRMSRHLLVTAGDDGSIHLWDTTARSPKMSWLKHHSAPTSAVSFLPSNDKIIASVGLDMKLYVFESGSRKPSSCISYEAPFSSLAVADDGLTLAAGTSTGQVVFYDVRGKPQPITILRAYGNSEAVTSLCWQRSRPITVTESKFNDETVLLAGDVSDSVLMPDPLPSKASSFQSSASNDLVSFPVGSTTNALSLPASEETPYKNNLLTAVTLKRLHPARTYNIKDDMEVFSPLVEVQPITPDPDKMWRDADANLKKDNDKRSSLPFSNWRFGRPEDKIDDSHPISDWKSGFVSKQDDSSSSLASTSCTEVDDPSSVTPPEAWGGDRLIEKFINNRPTVNRPSRFSALTANITSSSSTLGIQGSLPTSQNTSTSTSLLSLPNLHTQGVPSQGVSFGVTEAVSLPFGSKSNASRANLDNHVSLPRRLSSYAERIGASFSDAPSLAVASPKSKKSGAETRGDILSNLLLKSEMASDAETAGLASSNNVEGTEKGSLESETQQGTSFTLQLFQHTLEESLASFQKSIHEDMRNLHIEILRQFHMQETEMSGAMGLILENQAEIMKEIQSLRRETQQLRQLL